MLVVHEQRHVLQAKRLMTSGRFNAETAENAGEGM